MFVHKSRPARFGDQKNDGDEHRTCIMEESMRWEDDNLSDSVEVKKPLLLHSNDLNV